MLEDAFAIIGNTSVIDPSLYPSICSMARHSLSNSVVVKSFTFLLSVIPVHKYIGINDNFHRFVLDSFIADFSDSFVSPASRVFF